MTRQSITVQTYMALESIKTPLESILTSVDT
jgi:hypothetical protein